MKRLHTWLLLSCLAFGGTVPQAHAQTAESPEIPQAIKESVPTPTDSPVSSKIIYSKFETLENPPMELGAIGDRVCELQATLNSILGNRTDPINLGQTILVGPARGAGENDKKSQIRIVYIEPRELAFQIRGDWEPYDEDGVPLQFSDEAGSYDLKPTQYLKLPNQPLKVDGIFGQHTQAAVMLFQLERSLPVTGEVDPVTLDKLEPLIPTNPILASILGSIHIFDPLHDNYPVFIKTWTALIATFLILLTSAAVYQIARVLATSTHFLSRWLFTPSSSPWFTALINQKFFLRSALFAPAIFIYLAARIIFPTPHADDSFPYLTTFQDWHIYVTHLGLALMSLVFTLVAMAVANAANEIYNPDHETENPISGIIRACKRLIGVFGIILIGASIAGKSPFLIIGGLGAFMAVILLVFRDFLLGMAASVQIIANQVVKVGDWITMPKYNADGDVTSITLTSIKVQNFDKTISTIPTYAVLTESFRNWTGMQTAGGRRIKRSILIDMQSIQICTPEMTETFQQIELLRDYLQLKESELEEYNRSHDVEASHVNIRRLTNIGTFRAYVLAYLGQHPGLNPEMTFLVRHLQPTSQGLPIEIYAFCNETAWAQYEAVQADIFDHLLSVLPEFGLRTYQEISDRAVQETMRESQWDCQEDVAQIEQAISEANGDLAQNSRSRVDSRLQKVRKLIGQLGLEQHLDVIADDRTLRLQTLGGIG